MLNIKNRMTMTTMQAKASSIAMLLLPTCFLSSVTTILLSSESPICFPLKLLVTETLDSSSSFSILSCRSSLFLRIYWNSLFISWRFFCSCWNFTSDWLMSGVATTFEEGSPSNHSLKSSNAFASP